MKTAVIKFGLIAGLILSLMVMIMVILEGGKGNFESGQSLGYLFQVTAYSMIFFGIREYRDKKLGGEISFNKAFRCGILIVITGAMLYTITWLIYLYFFDDGFTDRYTSYIIDQIRASDKSADEIEKEVELFSKNMIDYNQPATRMIYTFLEIFPLGLMITILCALLMRKRAVA